MDSPTPHQLTGHRRAAETKRLLHDWRTTGDRRARDRIVFIYAPLVRYIAYRKIRELPASCEVDDLVGAGLVALIESIERWDPERGVSFEQFAWPRLQGAMVDELR